MKTTNTFILLMFFYFFSFAQNDSRIGITFLDKKLSEKNSLKTTQNDIEKKQKSLIENSLNKFPKNDSKDYYWLLYSNLNSLINSSKELDNYGKALGYFWMSEILIYNIIEDENNIYNFSEFLFSKKEEFCDKLNPKILKGANKVNSLLDSAIKYADENRKDYLIKFKLTYFENSFIFEATMRFYADCANFEACKLFKGVCTLKNIESLLDNEIILQQPEYRNILKLISDNYKISKFNPNFSFVGLNTGINMIIAKENWLGGEISIDHTGNRNPFKRFDKMGKMGIGSRSSLFGINYNKSLTSDKSEFSMFALRLTNLSFFNLNIFQLGLQRGSEFNKVNNWYYRPEIGCSYGIFTVAYSYNFMFHRDARLIAETYMLNLRLSYPFIRLSRYQ